MSAERLIGDTTDLSETETDSNRAAAHVDPFFLLHVHDPACSRRVRRKFDVNVTIVVYKAAMWDGWSVQPRSNAVSGRVRKLVGLL